MSETQPLMQEKPPQYQPTAPPPGQPTTQPYYPPQTGYQAAPPPPAATTNVTVVQTAPVTGAYGEAPCSVTCPTCHNQVNTLIAYQTGGFAWLMVFLLFLVGFIFPLFWFGLCFIPLCIDGCKDIVHICPVCRTKLGYKNRM